MKFDENSQVKPQDHKCFDKTNEYGAVDHRIFAIQLNRIAFYERGIRPDIRKYW